MVPTNHDGRLQLAARDHLIECQAKPMAVAQTYPAYARRQTLKAYARLGHVQPIVQMLVIREQFLHLGVGAPDVLGITRECCPPERPDAAAKERANVGRDKARKVESVSYPFVPCHLADVVAIVKRRYATPVKFKHRTHVFGHGMLGGSLYTSGIEASAFFPLSKRPALGQIAVDRIMSGGLVRHNIGADAAAHELRKDLCRIANQPNRQRFSLPARALNQRQRLVKRVCLSVEIPSAQPHFYSARLTFDRQQGSAGHYRRKRLRSAHATKACGQDPLTC